MRNPFRYFNSSPEIIRLTGKNQQFVDGGEIDDISDDGSVRANPLETERGVA
jgi:hypothetical protein